MDRAGAKGSRSAALSRGAIGLAAAVALLLPACRVASPPPPKEIQDQALGASKVAPAWKAGGEAGPVQGNWLASFSDPQLNALVDEALANNPDLRIAGARVEQAAGYLEVARAALKPTVGLFGTGGLKMGGGDLSSALQGVLLGVSWEPDLWGRLRYARNAAQEVEASARADYEFARLSLAAATARSWFTAAATWLELQAAGEMVQSSHSLVTLSENRLQVGRGDEQDVALARASSGSLEDAEKQARFAYEQALRALEILLGRYPGAEVATRHDLPGLPGPVPAGMPLEVLERRPDLISAERRVAAAFNRVGEAKAAKLPKLTLNASAAAVSSDVLQLKEGFSNPTGGIGGRLVAPIYTGGALTAQVAIRTAEQKEAVAEYARTAWRAIGDVETALSAGKILADREQILRRVSGEQQRALELENVAYRVGRSDLRGVRQREIDAYNARVVLLRVQSDELIQRVNLHLALGGDFGPPPAPPEPGGKPETGTGQGRP
jgi:multidrug efflux system outer membrane protein